MAELLDYLRFEREVRKPIFYTALAFVLFLMFLVADFPYDGALSTLLAPSGLRLDYQDQHLSLPFGARLDDVTLRYADGAASGSMLAESASVTVSPTIGSLLLGRPGVRIVAKLRDGWLRVTLSAHRGATNVSFTATDVALASVGALSQFAQGTLSGDGSIDIDDPKTMAGTGAVELSGKRLAVRLGPGLPAIELDEATATLKLDNGVVAIENFEGHGRDLSVSASGTIELAPALLQSIADLSVTLRTTASGAQRFGPLLGFLPHPPGPRPYIVRGPLGFPSVG